MAGSWKTKQTQIRNKAAHCAYCNVVQEVLIREIRQEKEGKASTLERKK